MKIVVGVSGASGAIYGIRLLEKLRLESGVEVHLILTRSGEKTLFLETGRKAAELKSLAHCSYALEDISGRLASGSFRTDGMVIAPCSIHTMSAIAAGVSSNLLIRAADVTLKERRPLILMVRESPLHLGHLRTLVALRRWAPSSLRRCPPSITTPPPFRTWWTTAWTVSSICSAFPARARGDGTAR